MNTMVAARVPAEIKEQGDGILRSLGSSPTELINKAYDYVVRHRALPGDLEDASYGRSVVRTVTPDLLESLRASYEEMSLPLADVWGDKSFKEIQDEVGEERYARFA